MKHKYSLLLFAFVGFIIGVGSFFLLETNSQQIVKTNHPSYAHVVKKSLHSVVNIQITAKNKKKKPLHSQNTAILTNFNHTNKPFLANNSDVRQGAGVIMSKDGYIITNYHLIEDVPKIQVQLPNKEIKIAQLIGSDPETDIAVLKIDHDNLLPITLSKKNPPQVGDIVLAIGNPFGLGQTVTQGIISAKGRSQLGVSTFENFLQTDAAINPGNSGGALINTQGELIGINTAILTHTGYTAGVGFAIPIESTLKIMHDLIKYGRTQRGWLGIEIGNKNINNENQSIIQVTGLYEDIGRDSGLKIDDIITHIEKQPVTSLHQFRNIIANQQPNDMIQISIKRQKKRLVLQVKVSLRPIAYHDPSINQSNH